MTPNQALLYILVALPLAGFAQTVAPASAPATGNTTPGETILLSPFEVKTDGITLDRFSLTEPREITASTTVRF